MQPETFLPLAIGRLHEFGRVKAVSSVYQSPAVGSVDQPDFLNAAALVLTTLTWTRIKQRLRDIEAALGRVREGDKFAARTIDLDLFLYGGIVVREADALIPLPETMD